LDFMVFWRVTIISLGLVLSPVMTPGSPAWALIDHQSDFDAAVATARQSMMRDPQVSLDVATEAEMFINMQFATADRPVARATLAWLRAEALTRLSRPLEAQPVAQEALAHLGENPEPTKLYADILVAIARIEKLTGAYGGSLEHFQAAYAVYREIGESRSEAIVLQSIAQIYKDAHQYQRAVDYYLNATARYQDDPSLDLAAHNNLGTVYREMGQLVAAREHFDRALDAAEEMDSAMLQARILSNIAALQVDQSDPDGADISIDRAFELIAGAGGDWSRFLWGVRAQAALNRGDLAAARTAIRETFEGLDLSQTTSAFTEFHETAAQVFEASGNAAAALPHLRAFKRLDDEARAVAASANSVLLGAQFDFAEQELQIEQLRTEGLEQALALADARARQQFQLFVGALVLGAVLIVGAALFYRMLQIRNAALRRALFHDAETGLPTRFAAEKRIEELDFAGLEPLVLAVGIERYLHLESAVGLDRLAELKKGVAARLLQDPDVDTVVVLSRGALGVVLTEPAVRTVDELASDLRALLEAPLEVGEIAIDITATIGLARDALNGRALRDAMLAVEQAREAGRFHAVYDEQLQQDHSQNLTLMSRMLAAIEQGHMQMHYQPKLDLKSGTYRSAEALVRWNDPERGYIPPDSFIALAEETGRIREFTEWSIEQVARDQQYLKCRDGHDIQISINISGALISDPDFARVALDKVAALRGSIAFEITETAAMRNPDLALRTLNLWREAGIRLSIDDYGAGLSSLSYLQSLPAQELKLDRAFVSNIASSQRDRMLVKSTADLAHALGLEMTAEGVEDETGLAILKMLGCDWAQGFVLSRALPLEALRFFLSENAGGRDIDTRLPGTGTLNLR
jgi:EAL domain-containing protein (putative c-di-GMP-specific phosphodiesterase class I)